jgi:para-aminobenzoate synthetase component 1
VSHVLVAEPIDRAPDAVRLFAAIERQHPDVFWFEGSAPGGTGWSVIGIGARRAAIDDLRAVPLAEAPVAGAASMADRWPAGPFRGGWVGWFAYEDGAARNGAPVHTSESAAGATAFVEAGCWVSIRHIDGAAWAVAPPDAVGEWAREVARMLATESPPPPGPVAHRTAVSRHEPDEYAALIGRCRDAIRRGDAYQLCLTTRFEVETGERPADVYRRLRGGSPAPHGGFVRIGAVSLLSASPEEFVTVRSGIIRTRPIKGTRPRGADPAADAALADELLASEKERAENVMIVDLMRNDLARLCETGTVRVDALLAIESYPHVHQLVSTVSGHLRRGAVLGELVDRAFPAGSMTGAPKLSAMGILHDLEGAPRGVYAGCFGWVGVDGTVELAMVIRTIVMSAGRAVVGAGGGITWSSDAAEEVHEVGVKARAPLAVLGATLPPGW